MLLKTDNEETESLWEQNKPAPTRITDSDQNKRVAEWNAFCRISVSVYKVH